ncbi:hypothetical protein GCM10011345_03490 [Gemmobacter megaterium]|nr:hypothetical protein [Gemmobacter megaterium]GGE01523.1 hypothetical protein GCM10011345_03490 [Gemmobacter megaterium]
MWQFGKKSSQQKFDSTPPAPAPDANDFLRLSRALDSIGFETTEVRNKTHLAAKGASHLLRTLEIQLGEPLHSAAPEIFLMIASNYLSQLVKAQFETVTSLAFLTHFRHPEELPFAAELYNTFTRGRVGFVSDIGNAIALWVAKPNEATLQGLARRLAALDNAFSEDQT